ncbi:MAG: GntR family transcriptional regulator [Pseudonocardiaceae bacterium]
MTEPGGGLTKRDAIIEEITRNITTGVYAAHDGRLPTESDLTKQFEVSRITVRGALDRLAAMGLVRSVRGHGWYVREDKRRRYPLLTIDDRGGATRDVWRTWLEKNHLRGDHELVVTIEVPDNHVIDHLRLGPGAPCARRRRIRTINEEPVMISTAYFPMHLTDGTRLAEGTELARVGSGDDVDLDHPSPLDILKQIGNEIAADEDQIGARMPEPEEAKDLELPRGVPVITNCRTSYDDEGRPVRCTHDVMAAHHFLLVVHHEHPPAEGGQP